MNLILAALLCLLALTTRAQDTWPRNSKTGKIEFRGSLPWPTIAKTEAQRRALARRWYLAKLTVLSPAQVAAAALANKANGLLTYAGLPKVVIVRQEIGAEAATLGFFASLTATATGLSYQLTRFDYERLGDVETSEATPLEKKLAAATPNEQAALAALRKRLAAAVAGW